jgi:hypothetical protein
MASQSQNEDAVLATVSFIAKGNTDYKHSENKVMFEIEGVAGTPLIHHIPKYVYSILALSSA